jgi:hypothetical protein
MDVRTGRIGTIALLAALAAAGCSAEQSASVSAVIPSEAFIGRATQVLVVGSGTDWGDGVALDFGENVAVTEVIVASPTALYATIQVGAGARAGARDVVVRDGDGALTYSGAFALEPPLAIIEGDGTPAQGSFVNLRVINRDFETPFDTTDLGDGVTVPRTFPNIAIDAGEGVRAQPIWVDSHEIEIQLQIDATAAPGPRIIEIESGADEQLTSFAFPEAYTIEQRMPVPLVAGEPAAGRVDDEYQSTLYRFAPAALSILDLAVEADTPVARAGFAVLPASGSFADVIGYGGAARVIADEPHYVIYWDASGAAGYSFHLSAKAVEAAAAPEREPNDSIAAAQAGERAPLVVRDASLRDARDQDWIQIDVALEDVGKSIRVFTAGDPYTDLQVEVLTYGGLSLGGPSDDLGWHEDHTSEPVWNPGPHYVRIYASPEFRQEHGAYEAAITLE